MKNRLRFVVNSIGAFAVCITEFVTADVRPIVPIAPGVPIQTPSPGGDFEILDELPCDGSYKSVSIYAIAKVAVPADLVQTVTAEGSCPKDKWDDDYAGFRACTPMLIGRVSQTLKQKAEGQAFTDCSQAWGTHQSKCAPTTNACMPPSRPASPACPEFAGLLPRGQFSDTCKVEFCKIQSREVEGIYDISVTRLANGLCRYRCNLQANAEVGYKVRAEGVQCQQCAPNCIVEN